VLKRLLPLPRRAVCRPLDPNTPGYVSAKELPDGAVPPADAYGNFIIGPTHNPAPEMAVETETCIPLTWRPAGLKTGRSISPERAQPKAGQHFPVALRPIDHRGMVEARTPGGCAVGPR
jgi:hypothetical protein